MISHWIAGRGPGAGFRDAPWQTASPVDNILTGQEHACGSSNWRLLQKFSRLGPKSNLSYLGHILKTIICILGTEHLCQIVYHSRGV
jgi:hypothetical protein